MSFLAFTLLLPLSYFLQIDIMCRLHTDLTEKKHVEHMHALGCVQIIVRPVLADFSHGPEASAESDGNDDDSDSDKLSEIPSPSSSTGSTTWSMNFGMPVKRQRLRRYILPDNTP